MRIKITNLTRDGHENSIIGWFVAASFARVMYDESPYAQPDYQPRYVPSILVHTELGKLENFPLEKYRTTVKVEVLE